MDTNVKKLNERTGIKAVCIILSIVIFGLASAMAFDCFRAMAYEEDIVFKNNSGNINATDSQKFMSRLAYDIDGLSYDTKSNIALDQYDAAKSKEKTVVDEMQAAYEKECSESIKDYFEEYSSSYYYDDYSEYFNCNAKYTMPKNTDKSKLNIDQDAPLFIRNVQTILELAKGNEFINYVELIPSEVLEEYYFTYDLKIDKDGENVTEPISLSYAEAANRENLEDEFESTLDEAFDDYNYYDQFEDEYTKNNSFRYLVVNTKTNKIYTNTDLSKDEAKKYILSCDIFYQNINGEVSQNGLDRFTSNYYTENVFKKGYECYVAVDTKYASSNDDYANYLEIAKSLSNRNFTLEMVGSISMFVISLILAIFVFCIAANKKNLVDRINLDIHFAISCIVATIVICGFILVIEGTFGVNLDDIILTIIYSYPALVISLLLGSLLFGIVCEFILSLIRTIKSGERLRDNLVIYRIIRWCWHKFKNILAGIIGLFKYKPREIDKRTQLAIILLLGFDVFLIFFCGVASGEPMLQIIVFLIFALLNSYVAKKAIDYAKKLDKVIISAKERTEISDDINNYPKSLKILAESLKYTNDELKIAVEQAVKDERLKSELITNVSHDLKTPLTSIITYVDLLSKCDINDDKAKEYIGVLDEKGAKLKRLIEDLIEASKVSSGNITLNITKINLSELVIQATGEVQEDFDSQLLEIVSKTPEKDISIFADGNKTFRVVENLLSNAKKYSATNSRVYINIDENENYGIFEIKNISAQPLDITPQELTERFVRGDKSRTREGNGLGLSIAKELCNAMGGKLELIIDGDLFKARVYLPKNYQM